VTVARGASRLRTLPAVHLLRRIVVGVPLLAGAAFAVALLLTPVTSASAGIPATTFRIITIPPFTLVNPSIFTLPPSSSTTSSATTTTTSSATTTTTTSTTAPGPGPTSGAGQLGGTVRTADSDADAADAEGDSGGMTAFVYGSLAAAVVLVAAGGIILGRARASGD